MVAEACWTGDKAVARILTLLTESRPPAVPPPPPRSVNALMSTFAFEPATPRATTVGFRVFDGATPTTTRLRSSILATRAVYSCSRFRSCVV